MKPPIVFVTGMDPVRGKGGGSAYVRTHARAAQLAGYAPQLFCLSDRDEVVETDFGMVHRVATPFRPRGSLQVEPGQHPERVVAHWLAGTLFTPYAVALHAPFLVRGIERFMLADPTARLLHGFHNWGGVALKARDRLSRRGRKAQVVNSVYTTLSHEVRGKLRGIEASGSRRLRGLYRIEQIWNRVLSSRWERLVFETSPILALNYESVRKLVEEECGGHGTVRRLTYCPESAFLRPHRANEPELPAPRAHSQAPLIVTVSRHDPRKGLEVLLRALALLRDAGVPFRARLGSGGPLFAYHQQLITELALGELVELTDWLDAPFELLRAGDLFVLPSLEEGSGSLALLEAMQAGLAIVASNIDGIPEDVTDGRDGLLVAPGEPESLAGALRRLLLAPELRRRLGGAAAATFARRFSAAAFSRELGALYAELLEDRLLELG